MIIRWIVIASLCILSSYVSAECLVERVPPDEGEKVYAVPLATCQTTDCSKQYFFGVITYSHKMDTEYYGAKIYIGASPPQCLRVNIIDPNNRYMGFLQCPETEEPDYRERHPLIVHSTKEGWCRLIVHNIGKENIEPAFYYNVGRYTLPNVNCVQEE